MNKTIAFLNLIRLQNLLIIALTQYIIKYSLLNYFVNDFILSNLNFSILVFTTILIAAGGYIINDIYDVETDKINKEGNIIIEKSISSRTAIHIYYLLNIIALTGGIYLAFNVQAPILSLVFIYSIYSLWIYSKKFKKSLLIGNLQVALLTALCIFNIALFDILADKIVSNDGELIILKIIAYYAGFSAIITLIREIIKDIEDYKGDVQTNATTLVINYGVKISKGLSILLIIILTTLIGYFQYFQYSVINSEFEYNMSIWGVNNIASSYIMFIQVLLAYLGAKIYLSKNKKDFYLNSQLCKVIMVLGVLSIPLFTYTHLN